MTPQEGEGFTGARATPNIGGIRSLEASMKAAKENKANMIGTVFPPSAVLRTST